MLPPNHHPLDFLDDFFNKELEGQKFKDLRYCKECKIKLSSSKEAIQHFQGKKHKVTTLEYVLTLLFTRGGDHIELTDF